jgi:hypothetical protein
MKKLKIQSVTFNTNCKIHIIFNDKTEVDMRILPWMHRRLKLLVIDSIEGGEPEMITLISKSKMKE